MTFDKQTLDWVVAEVVRRVSELTTSEAGPETKITKQPKTETVQPPTDLLLDVPLVTLASVAGRLRGIHRVLVPARAVITPAVRDELRKKKVRLEKGEMPQSNGHLAGSLWLGKCTTTNGAVQKTASLIEASGTTVEDCQNMEEATKRVVASVSLENGTAVLLTDRPLVAACLVNRCAAVRAAIGNNVDSAREALRTIGANVLIVDSSAITPFVWRQLVRVVGSNETRQVPTELL